MALAVQTMRRSRAPKAALMSVCAAAMLISVACRSQEKKVVPRLNLVLVTIDTLRPDRLGCYGHPNNETPNLDSLARKGALFENATAQIR